MVVAALKALVETQVETLVEVAELQQVVLAVQAQASSEAGLKYRFLTSTTSHVKMFHCSVNSLTAETFMIIRLKIIN